MTDVTIRTRENGPLIVTGPFTLVDHQQTRFEIPAGKDVALCRCGASAKKPFCDGAHRGCGFVAGELSPHAPNAVPESPQTPNES